MNHAIPLLFLLLGGVIWLWADTLRVRELALEAARDICRRQDLQLLDATVALRRVALRRASGRLRLERTFQFLYSSAGDDRLSGFVIVSGYHVEQVGL